MKSGTSAQSMPSVGKNTPGFRRSLLLWATVASLAINFLPAPYNYIILYPFRLFVTFVHESGHAFAAIITGGEVRYLQVFPNAEGVTLGATPGWAQWIFLSGGYIGATIFGAVLLQVVNLSGWKNSLYVLAAYLLFVTLMWAHNPIDNLFTLVTGVVLAALLFVCARRLKPETAAFVLTFLAVQCCLNAVDDLRALLYLTTQTNRDNDAVFMSKQYLLPPPVWAGLWAVCAALILAVAFWFYLRGSATVNRKRSG